MAITPKVLRNEELTDTDFANINLWEHHFDFTLTVLRDWRNEEELFNKLDGVFVPEQLAEGEESLIHLAKLNELLVNLSQVKARYGVEAESKFYVAIPAIVPLKNDAELRWNPLYAPEIIKRYEDSGWGSVEHRTCGIDDPKHEGMCTLQYVLVFTPPKLLQLEPGCQEEAFEPTEPPKVIRRFKPAANKNSGWVYLLKAENGLYKIGRSKTPNIRISAITRAVAPFKIEEIHKAYYPDCLRAERSLHQRFKDKRELGEWFALTADDVKAVIEHPHEAL